MSESSQTLLVPLGYLKFPVVPSDSFGYLGVPLDPLGSLDFPSIP